MYNIDGDRLDGREPMEISQQRYISQTERFRTKMHSMFGNTYVYESIFCTMKQVKFKNRNRMANQRLDDGLRLATTNIGIHIGTIVSEKPRPQASTDRDL